MNDRDANQPGADPSKDLSDQILAQKFPPAGVQQGCGQQLLNYDHSNHSTLTPAAAPGIYQLGATFYPNVSSNQQQGYFQTNYGAPGAIPSQPGLHAPGSMNTRETRWYYVLYVLLFIMYNTGLYYAQVSKLVSKLLVS